MKVTSSILLVPLGLILADVSIPKLDRTTCIKFCESSHAILNLQKTDCPNFCDSGLETAQLNGLLSPKGNGKLPSIPVTGPSVAQKSPLSTPKLDAAALKPANDPQPAPVNGETDFIGARSDVLLVRKPAPREPSAVPDFNLYQKINPQADATGPHVRHDQPNPIPNTQQAPPTQPGQEAVTTPQQVAPPSQPDAAAPQNPAPATQSGAPAQGTAPAPGSAPAAPAANNPNPDGKTEGETGGKDGESDGKTDGKDGKTDGKDGKADSKDGKPDDKTGTPDTNQAAPVVKPDGGNGFNLIPTMTATFMVLAFTAFSQ